MEQYIKPEKKKQIREAMINAGAPDGSLRSVLLGMLKMLGEKVAGKAGDAFIGAASDKIFAPFFDGGIAKVASLCKIIFGTESQ